MLEGKVALVTGAGRGIGATIAETLAREGAFVVVNYRGSGQAAQELAEKIGGVAMQCDVADFEACENMIKTMIETYGHLDILVNNVIGLTKSVARELASRGITCNAVAPGFIETDMTDAMTESAKEAVQKQIPLGRCGNTKDVAELVTFLASDKAAYITGQVISVDGGMCM